LNPKSFIKDQAKDSKEAKQIVKMLLGLLGQLGIQVDAKNALADLTAPESRVFAAV
jgi:hypothetical protein